MIRKLFQSLFGWPHEHEWELLEKMQYQELYPVKKIGAKPQTKANYPVWVYRCKTCGHHNRISGGYPS